MDNESRGIRRKLLNGFLIVLLLASVAFGGLYVKSMVDAKAHNAHVQQEKQHAESVVDDLVGSIDANDVPQENSTPEETPKVETKEKKKVPVYVDDDGYEKADLTHVQTQPVYKQNAIRKLKSKNPEAVAWLNVGNVISLPVMQHPNDDPVNGFYLSHDFNKQPSEWGTPYVSGSTNPGESMNTPIYAHSGMTYGTTMFSPLTQFEKASIARKNEQISLVTEDTTYVYRIAYVYKSATWAKDGIPIISPNLEQGEYEMMIDSIAEKAQRFYSNADAESVKASRIITLVTCDVQYDKYNGRTFVIGELIGSYPTDGS